MHIKKIYWAGLFCLSYGTSAFAPIKSPPQPEWDKATADIAGSDAAAQTAAVENIKGWIKGGWVSQDVWRKWLPSLVKAGRHQDAYDIATLALCWRPGPEAATTLQESRMKAMQALGKNEEALKMARAYYNVVDIKGTAAAVDFLGTCLAKARTDDLEIVRKFRNEQAEASKNPPVVPEKAILKDITIDDAPFAAALKTLSGKLNYQDQVGYGNLLLIAGHGEEAEKVFKELYALAGTAEQLTQAAEGVARALRAQDGTVARANAWLAKVAAANATQPSTAPASKPAPSAGLP